MSNFVGHDKPPIDDVIEHFGVKGMKWGQRKAEDGGGGQRGPVRRGLTKANTALDAGSHVIKEGEKGLIFLPKEHRDQAASATQNRVLGVARQINKDPKYHGKDLKKDSNLKREYYNEVQKHATTIYKDELEKARGRAVVDTINTIFSPGYGNLSYTTPRTRVRHADAPDTQIVLTLHFEKDDLGQIVNITTSEPASLQQSIDYAEEHLEHFGVKGMKWGVRRENRLQTAQRVASGQAGRLETVKFVNTNISNKSLRVGGGYRGAAKNKAAELQARKDRIQSGKATVSDLVSLSPAGRVLDRSGRTAEKAQKEASKTAVKEAKKAAKLQTAQERENFYQEKANHILEVAAKDPQSLIMLAHPGGRTIVTGNEFVQHMSNGGYMNIKATDVYATRPKNATAYELNPSMNKPFVPSHKK